MKFKQILAILTLCCTMPMVTAFGENSASPNNVNGGEWVDMDGNRINCHGGNIIKSDSLYYWYGEHRPGFDANYQKGISCYSSKDLKNWKNEGIVLSVSEDTTSVLAKGGIMERPKAVYCPKTGKYVLWFHHELRGQGYGAAHAAVAESDNPTGPFKLIRSSRVNPGKYPVNFTKENKNGKEKIQDFKDWWTPEWRKAVINGMFTRRDYKGGQMSRDMTIFVDDDGKAYHIYSSEENATLHIAELTDDFTDHTDKYIRIFPTGLKEAPVMFKHGGKYWMVTSGCTGWAPNKAQLLYADEIMGEWKELPSPCIGEKWETTFEGQGAFPLTVDGQIYFVADIWHPKQLADSRTLILPVLFDANDVPVIPYVNEVPFFTKK